MKSKKGFTLIEVMVVIGIIAVLTVISFPAINNIRAKNRDAEKVSDIAAIQLGLSLYRNSSPTNSYPNTLEDLLPKNYVTADSLSSPNSDLYIYVPLAKTADVNARCTYYHLGVKLESSSAQIDAADNFTSTPDNISNGYSYCGYDGLGLATGTLNYNVHP
jgi:prepilin-type N-terminal cleavage/methylation domain-containing protein